MRICIWPDDTWCEADQIESFAWKSDDYETAEVPDSVDDVDGWVADREEAAKRERRR